MNYLKKKGCPVKDKQIKECAEKALEKDTGERKRRMERALSSTSLLFQMLKQPRLGQAKTRSLELI